MNQCSWNLQAFCMIFRDAEDAKTLNEQINLMQILDNERSWLTEMKRLEKDEFVSQFINNILDKWTKILEKL